MYGLDRRRMIFISLITITLKKNRSAHNRAVQYFVVFGMIVFV